METSLTAPVFWRILAWFVEAEERSPYFLRCSLRCCIKASNLYLLNKDYTTELHKSKSETELYPALDKHKYVEGWNSGPNEVNGKTLS